MKYKLYGVFDSEVMKIDDMKTYYSLNSSDVVECSSRQEVFQALKSGKVPQLTSDALAVEFFLDDNPGAILDGFKIILM